MKIFEDDKITVYQCSDNRCRAYIKETKKVVSYPRLVMEEKLGRPLLENEQAHHKNENPLDNDPNNLTVELLGDHQRFHSKNHFERKYYDEEAICVNCKKIFIWTAEAQRNFYGHFGNLCFKHGPFCCRSCSGSFSIKQNSRAALQECIV